MLKPQNVLDNLIRTIKTYDGLSDLRFVKGRKTQNAEKPVTSFFVACFVGAVHKEKDARANRRVEANLCFQVYAPFDKGGAELNSLCASLMDALDRADVGGVISEINILDAVYDNDLCTQTQSVRAKLLWEVTSEQDEELAPSLSADSVEIIVNNKAVKVLSAHAHTKNELYILRELLCGDTGVIPKGSTYALEIRVRCDSDPFAACENPDISLVQAGDLCVFRNCVVQKITEKKEPKNADERQYSFLSLQRETIERNGE